MHGWTSSTLFFIGSLLTFNCSHIRCALGTMSTSTHSVNCKVHHWSVPWKPLHDLQSALPLRKFCTVQMLVLVTMNILRLSSKLQTLWIIRINTKSYQNAGKSVDLIQIGSKSDMLRSVVLLLQKLLMSFTFKFWMLQVRENEISVRKWSGGAVHLRTSEGVLLVAFASVSYL